MLLKAHLEILASASQHQHRHWRRHQHLHCKFFCFSKSKFLSFEVSCEVKHLWWSPFQIHLQALLGVFAAVWSSYSVETSLAPAFQEMNSAMDVISEVLKTHKAESCSLYVCVFLIRNYITDHFQEIFCKSQNTFKKFG